MLATLVNCAAGAEPLPAEKIGKIGPIPVGKSEIEVAVNGTNIKVYTYRPKTFNNGPLILVMHGVLRNADEYRDHAVKLGDKFNALVAAPKFDDQRFPNFRYQRAGIVNDDGTAVKPEDRTGVFLPKIAAEIRKREKNEKMPYYLIGHSAGAQFLARSAAFVSLEAERIVAANPGTHLFPDTDAKFPLGFGGLPKSIDAERQMQHYFKQPLTFYLGSCDIERDEYLDVAPSSDRQGKNRYERGQNNFAAAQKLAAQKGWTFNWRLVVADGVDHDHEKMFAHPACKDALFPKEQGPRKDKTERKVQIKPIIAVHGGYTSELRQDPATLKAKQDSIACVIAQAEDYLLGRVDGTQHTAVETGHFAVRLLEENPLFNAGLGARFQQDGQIRRTASIMGPTPQTQKGSDPDYLSDL
jgi:hypothetical protein